jgi:hypothetical protein
MASNPKVFTDRSNAARAAKRLGGERVRVAGGWIVQMPEAEPTFAPEPAACAADDSPRIERRTNGFWVVSSTAEAGPFVTERQAKSEARRSVPGKARAPKESRVKASPKTGRPDRALKGRRAETEAAAARGELPNPPDFSAETHKRHRARLQSLVDMVAAGDIDGLRKTVIEPHSSSRKAMFRYRELAVMALAARGTLKRAA